MKSKITIEIDFENGNQPIIQILQRKSDDVRDNLIQSFLQSLQHTSRWGRIIYAGNFGTKDGVAGSTIEEVHKWIIQPIKINEIGDEIKLMDATISPRKPI